MIYILKKKILKLKQKILNVKNKIKILKLKVCSSFFLLFFLTQQYE